MWGRRCRDGAAGVQEGLWWRAEWHTVHDYSRSVAHHVQLLDYAGCWISAEVGVVDVDRPVGRRRRGWEPGGTDAKAIGRSLGEEDGVAFHCNLRPRHRRRRGRTEWHSVDDDSSSAALDVQLLHHAICRIATEV